MVGLARWDTSLCWVAAMGSNEPSINVTSCGSLRNLAGAFENAPDLVSLWTLDGRPVAFNRAARQVLGDPEGEDGLDRHVREVFGRDRISSALRQATSETMTAQFPLFARDESATAYLHSAHRFSADGQTWWMVVSKSLAELAPAHWQRENRDNIYFYALMGANDGVWDIHLDSQKVFYCPRYKAMLGYADDELKPTVDTWASLVHPEDRERVLLQVSRYLSREISEYSFEYRMLHRQGHYIWVLDRGAALWDEHGNAKRFSGLHTDITRQKTLEQEVRQQRTFIEKAMSTAPVMVTIVDISTGQLIYMNDAAKHAFPLSIGDDVSPEGNLLSEIVHPRDLPGVLRRFESLPKAADHEVLTVDLRIKSHDQSWSWFRSFARPFRRGPDGAVKEVITIAIDITEERIANRFLVQSRERLELALDASNSAIWDWNNETGRVYRSDQFYRILGYSPGEVGDKDIDYLSLVHPDDYQQSYRAAKDFTTGKAQSYEVIERLRCKDGSYRWFLSRGSGKFDSTGTCTRFYGASVDITDQKQTEDRLRLFELAAIHAEDGLAIFQSSDTRPVGLIFANPAFLKDTGHSINQVLGKPPTFLFGPTTEPEQQQRILQAIQQKVSDVVEVTCSRADGGSFAAEVAIYFVPTSQRNATHFVMAVRNVSKRRTAQQQLFAAHEEALRVSKLKSQFLANMSHEIRTPLNAIVGIADLLADGDLSEVAELTNTLRDSATALLDLINDMLDLSRIESGKLTLDLEPTHLATTIGDVCRTFQPSAIRKGLKMEWVIDESLQQGALIDALRLRQVLSNLISNAIKFTPQGSVKVVARGRPSLADNHIGVSIEVTDTGIGIPRESQSRIFESFTQADGSTTRTYGGSGLGLAICSQLVRLMGGMLAVESVPGQGSTFHFAIELAMADHLSAERDGDLSAVPMENRINACVLVVEDNPTNQRVITKVLEKLGCDVLVANDGEEALELLDYRRVNLVLMDVQMPVVDGYEATRRIRLKDQEMGLRMPVVALTAHAMIGDRERCLAAGMDDYISKPVIMAEVEAMLRRVLGPPVGEPKTE